MFLQDCWWHYCIRWARFSCWQVPAHSTGCSQHPWDEGQPAPGTGQGWDVPLHPVVHHERRYIQEGRYEVTHAEFDTRNDEYQRDLRVEITQNVSNFSCGLHQNAKRWLWFIPLTFFCTNCHKHTNMGRVYF